MIDAKIAFGAASIAASFVQYIPYFIDILKKKTKPHAFSWLVWALPSWIVCIAQIMAGGGDGAWGTGTSAAGGTVIFFMALVYGEKDIKRGDWATLAAALIAIALWRLTHNALVAVVLMTVAGTLAYVPTFRKSLKKPHEETLSLYFLGSFKWIFSILALDVYSVTTWLYPVGRLAASGILMATIVTRRAQLKHQLML